MLLMPAAAALVAIILFLSGCGIDVDTHHVVLREGDGTLRVELTILDHARIVDSATAIEVNAVGDELHVETDGPVSDRVVLSWAGIACETRPELTIAERQPGEVAMTLDRGETPPDVECAAAGIGYGVELSLADPLAAEDIRASITE